MIREGQRIDKRQTGHEWEDITIEEFYENCNIPFRDLAYITHEAFNRCFNVKKKSKTKTTRRKRSTS